MKTKLQLLFNSLLLLTILVCSTKGHSQINYTQSFNGSSDWDDIFDLSTTDACDANGSIRRNIYNFDYYTETISSSIGITNGMPITLTYDYKVVNFGELTAAPVDWGFIEVYYSTSPTGPFTLIQTINSSNHTASATCAAKTVTFTPTVGMPVYIGIYAEQDDFVSDVWLYLDNFHATQPPAAACTGLPAAAAASTSIGLACNTESFTLNLSPIPTASNITYQWQWSTDGVVYTNVPTGGTSASFTTTQTSTHWYRAAITCTSTGGGSVNSAPVKVNNSGTNCYCKDLEFSNGVEPITLVNFAGINNTSTNQVTSTPYLQNFTNTPEASVIMGQTYPIVIKGNTNGNYINYFKVYIDFNHNGVLSDPGETFELGFIENSSGLDATQISGNITIPGSALSGPTLMRVVKLYWYDNGDDEPITMYLNSPCFGEEHSEYGQAEDYIVNVQPCTTLAPVAAATQTFCPGATINSLAVTGTAVKWYAVATEGNALPAGAALVTRTYYASQTAAGCESARTPVNVTVTQVLADDPADVTSCGVYVLPALTNGTYRTAANGGGTVVTAGTPIAATTTLYIYAASSTTPVCTVDNAFTVNIVTSVVADDPADVSACTSYTLPALSANNTYRTLPAGGGTVIAAGTEITETTTLYVYASTTTTPACTAENSFTVTIYNAVADDPADVTSCGSYVLPALTNGTYHTAVNGGGATLAAGAIIEASATLYVFAQAGAGATVCVIDNAFDVTIYNLEVDELDDVTVCGQYELPEITNGTYYSGGNGLGQTYEAGDLITETSTIHIFAQQGTGVTACTAESTFTVVVLNAQAVEMDDVASCGDYQLPELPGGSLYFTQPGGVGEALPPGQPIGATTTIYIYTTTNSTPSCVAESSFEVVVTTVEALGDMTFTIAVENPSETTTLADYDLDAEGTVDWYPNEQAAIDQTPLLSLTTEVPFGTTTYYVRHRIGNCVSEPSTVTFTVILGTDKFDEAAFSYHPNPVTDVLNVSYSQNITQITVYNLLGQQVITKPVNTTDAQIDLGQLASGTYLVKVQTDNASKMIKIVKNR